VSEAKGSTKSRRLRIAAATIVSGGLLAPLAIFGGAGWAKGSPSAAQYQYKITICHHTHSKKNPFVTITISNRAWKAHAKHGDTLGPCATSKKASKHQSKSQSSTHSQKASGQSQKSSHSQSGNNGQSSGQTNGQSGSAPGKAHGK
jgi:hypothetical protein